MKEASAVAALLSDDEVAVAFEAGDCLIAIGAERELIAFDITLRAELAKGKTDRDWLKTKRDKLKERLDTLAAKAKPVPPPPIDETVTPLKRVLAALSDDMDAGKADRAWLAELKDKAYPAYHHILRDPGTKPAVARELFIRLKATAGDRSAFLPLALARLAHDDVDLRIAALNLIQAIGSSRDTSPVVALLGDERQLVSNLALETLATIGGENDLIALDIWLQSAGEKYKPNGLPRYYVEQRAKLQSRVEKERLPSKGLKK